MEEKEEKKTFASHPKSQYWSAKNKGKPEDYALNSHKKCWFNCDKCGHDFETTLLNINQSGNWCPYCYNRKVCGNCESCFENSFASHPKSQYWHSSNTCNPNEVIKGSNKKYYFNCDKCEHILFVSLKKISYRGQWCSYCGHQQLCEDNNCNLCFDNSFASVPNSKYLCDSSINPRLLFKSTNKKLEFNCPDCKQNFSTQLADITKGVWCPYCPNKTEKILYSKLKDIVNVKQQFKPTWCKNPTTNKYLPYDFVILDHNMLIELDGPQHFRQVHNWQTPELTRINDIYKMKCARQNGYSMIRILQKDVLFNRYDWLPELLANIEKIKTEGIVQNIYMCKNNEYCIFDGIDLDVNENENEVV
jgi:very-short-patch-repair endonuclease